MSPDLEWYLNQNHVWLSFCPEMITANHVCGKSMGQWFIGSRSPPHRHWRGGSECTGSPLIRQRASVCLSALLFLLHLADWHFLSVIQFIPNKHHYNLCLYENLLKISTWNHSPYWWSLVINKCLCHRVRKYISLKGNLSSAYLITSWRFYLKYIVRGIHSLYGFQVWTSTNYIANSRDYFL